MPRIDPRGEPLWRLLRCPSTFLLPCFPFPAAGECRATPFKASACPLVQELIGDKLGSVQIPVDDPVLPLDADGFVPPVQVAPAEAVDRKSTRLNSSHVK